MQDNSGVRRIAASRASSLPWLPPPAGYVILIQDVSYGNRYLIARHQRLDRQLMRRGADLPFETRVVQILEADNAAQTERDLYAELAPGAPAGQWFDLQRYPPAKPSPATQLGMASLRDLALNDVDAESLLQGLEIVDATARAPDPERPAASQSGALNRRRRYRLSRWSFLLAFIIIAGALAVDRSSDFRRAIHSILRPSPQAVSSRRAASPTTKPDGAGIRAATPATRIKLSQPELLLAERTETYIRINWYKMPQALSYQYRYSINGGAYSGWKTVNRFTYKLEGLSPGDWVTFRLRARRDGVYSPLAQVSAQTLPAPTATSIPPTATATDPPPTATETDTPTATVAPPTASESPPTDRPTATETDSPTATNPPEPTATATVAPAFKYVVETVGDLNANIRACPRTTCAVVANFAPGTEVDVLGRANGETVYGTDVWLEISLDDGKAYIHSELVAEAE